jgi:hypothetical protein
MYACILETGRGLFEGVCPPCNATAHYSDPPPLSIRQLLCPSLAAIRTPKFTSERSAS